jgi:hypothetical protein
MLAQILKKSKAVPAALAPYLPILVTCWYWTSGLNVSFVLEASSPDIKGKIQLHLRSEETRLLDLQDALSDFNLLALESTQDSES